MSSFGRDYLPQRGNWWQRNKMVFVGAGLAAGLFGAGFGVATALNSGEPVAAAAQPIATVAPAVAVPATSAPVTVPAVTAAPVP